jgi:hypothetical protein
MITLLVLAASACGSVGGGKPGTGGSGGGAGGGSGGAPDAAAGGGSGGSDAGAATDGRSDAADTAPLPVSCQAIKLQNPAAVSGVFMIAPLGTAQSVFCEMTSDNGGWTAFYIGDNGTTPGGMHFETTADTCPDPANSCIRRLPVNIDNSHDFAVKCGASVVKFKIPPATTAGTLPPVLDYFRNGLQHMWEPITNAVTIDIGLVGKANLVTNVWTGNATNYGWIVAGDQNTTSTTFGDGYTTNGSWNYCNGTGAPDSSRVMLFYR